MLKKSMLFAAAVAALLTAGQANAAYTLTAAITAPTGSTTTIGQTTITLASITPQSGVTQSDFNVIDVGVVSTAPTNAPNSGSFILSQRITLSGDTGTQVVDLTGTFNLVSGSTGGVTTRFTGTIAFVSGSGYTVTFAGYAPPSPGSTPGTANNGAISINVIPNVIPEPASVAMVGLGLASIGGLALRRRSAK